MIDFTTFLTEEASEKKLLHLEHVEDHVINSGFDGFAHAYHSLQDVHDKLHGKGNKVKVTTKYDGSPAVIFGHDPKTGKFFVASKSAFNATPKINYTPEDIERNHGHAPGLVSKLKLALEHLPKIAPKQGVFQGDIMHAGIKGKANPNGDVEKESGKLNFQANPSGIRYSTPASSSEGKYIAKAKIGVAVHTMYNGKNLADMEAEYAPDLSEFTHHPDVHSIDTQDEFQNAHMSPEQHELYQKHIKAAADAFKATPKKAYKVFTGKKIGAHADGTTKFEHEHHADIIKTYINKTVREGTTPTVSGYKSHLKDTHNKRIAGVKTAKAIGAKTEQMHADLNHVENNSEHFNSILTMHHHLQQAKNQLVQSLSSKPKYQTAMHDKATGTLKPTKPEGYVVVRNNRPSKLVDRDEFSRNNLNGIRT